MMKHKILPLYLASQSPRRRELLQTIGLNFSVYIPKIPELVAPKKRTNQSPSLIVKKIAEAKASAALQELTESGINEGIILSADTLVFIDKLVLGKPKDSKDARRMLLKLANNTHTVATAVHILMFKEQKLVNRKSIVVRTKVSFFPISTKNLDWYLSTGEPFDKAGAYGAQGYGSAFLRKFTGSYTNVVGLPVAETLQLLENISAQSWQTWIKQK